MAAKPCTEPGCPYPKKDRHPKWCMWHWLWRQPIDVQVAHSRRRKKLALEATASIERARVPEAEWPAGERFCAGCQSFVPLWYCTGSRCRADASAAAHASAIKGKYEITPEEYERLYLYQGGRCYICQRRTTRRMSVDHDHVTNEVRGLLCSDPERGCNHAILGNIRDLAMAKRIVEYLEDPPLRRMRAGVPSPRDLQPSRKQQNDALYDQALRTHFPGAYGTPLVEPQAPAVAPEPPAPVSPAVWDPFGTS